MRPTRLNTGECCIEVEVSYKGNSYEGSVRFMHGWYALCVRDLRPMEGDDKWSMKAEDFERVKRGEEIPFAELSHFDEVTTIRPKGACFQEELRGIPEETRAQPELLTGGVPLVYENATGAEELKVCLSDVEEMLERLLRLQRSMASGGNHESPGVRIHKSESAELDVRCREVLERYLPRGHQIRDNWFTHDADLNYFIEADVQDYTAKKHQLQLAIRLLAGDAR